LNKKNEKSDAEYDNKYNVIFVDGLKLSKKIW